MEFVEGQDLSTLLDERHKYTPEETVKILRQVCAALEAAHSEGVVHRDLKPQNIMIGEGGRVCVMDFGLARSMEAGGLTQAGAVMGTPAYMSPEQAKGMPADERSDLFSLGIIAYLMLTGEIPFKADSALASMLLRTQGPPTPSIQLNPAIPQALSDVVQKSLAVDPKDRYQSATELAKDLYDWQEGTLAESHRHAAGGDDGRVAHQKVDRDRGGMRRRRGRRWLWLRSLAAQTPCAGGADDRHDRRFQQSYG